MYICFCGHYDWRHDFESGDHAGHCRICDCTTFDADNPRMQDLEDQAKILRHDIERGK